MSRLTTPAAALAKPPEVSRRQHTSNKGGCVFRLSAAVALGNVVEQLAQVQAYLVGHVHHQVVAFVSVAVLKGSSGGVSVDGRTGGPWLGRVGGTHVSAHAVFVVHFALLGVVVVV